MPEESPTAEERLAAVLSSRPVVVSTQDAALRYTWIHNPIPEFGLEPADFIGNTDAELGRELGATEPGATEIDRMKQRVVDTGRRERRIIDLLTPDGVQVYLDTEVTPAIGAGGEVTGVTSIHVDVTAHHEAALEIARQRDRLHTLNKELEAFSYSVSHDLRAPLWAIDGFNKALLDDYGDQLGSQGADYLGRVRANAARMAEQIDDLLELSQAHPRQGGARDGRPQRARRRGDPRGRGGGAGAPPDADHSRRDVGRGGPAPAPRRARKPDRQRLEVQRRPRGGPDRSRLPGRRRRARRTSSATMASGSR